MTDIPSRSAPRPTPRWQYRANMALLAVIAVVILAFVDYFAAQSKAKADFTFGRVHSLSDQTHRLLQQIDQGTRDFILINTFSPDVDPEKFQQVDDLIDTYASNSGKIKVQTAHTEEDVSKLIKDRYKAELKPYKDASDQYATLIKKLTTQFKDEGDALAAAAATPGVAAPEAKIFRQVQTYFTSQLPEEIDRTNQAIEEQLNSTSPDWSATTRAMTEELDQITANLKQLITLGATPMSPSAAAYYKTAIPRLNTIIASADAMTKTIQGLPPLKSEEITRNAFREGILIVAPESLKTISSSEIYPVSADEDPRSTQATFEGEQAISSALLSLTAPSKPKVVFVSLSESGLTVGRGDFAAVTELLQKQNFEVLEWAAQPQPSQENPQPQPAGEPPASGAGVTWIVLPPSPPNQQMMMMGMPPPDPRPLVDAVKKHIDAGGNAFFFAEAAAGPMAMMAGDYPFTSIAKDFGVEIKSKYWAVQELPLGENGEAQAVPQVVIESYPDHPITKAMGALRLVFAPRFTEGQPPSLPTVIRPLSPAPAGITTGIFVQTPASKDYWGEVSPGETMKYDDEKTADGKPETDPDKRDLPAPVPLAVAAEKKLTLGGKNLTQRVAFIANKTWPSNAPVRARQLTVVGNGLASVARYPGNGQLFLNTVEWLGGYDNMIAVGPKASAALRIVAMSDFQLNVIRTLILAVVPLLALLSGAGVYFVRHR